jgi:hypothetical protein
VTTKKLTPKQQELAAKYAHEIDAYVALVRKANANQAAMLTDGLDDYTIAEQYLETMGRARDVYNDIDLGVMNDCWSIPFEASRIRTITAFMEYVESLTK